jgi:sugar phosphate isomerase/epimerase
MKLGLINSAWAQTNMPTREGIQHTKRIGFDIVDISVDPLDIDIRERKLIRDSCLEAGLPVISVCCCALGIADFAPPVQRFHVERAKAHIDLVYELEGRNLLLVLGEYIWQQEVIPPEAQWQWAVENVRQLGDYAANLGLEIAIELEPFHQSLVNDLPKMARFLDDVDHPAVRANADISHIALAGHKPEDIAVLKGRIAHVHFSDCDGKVHGDLPPGRGVVDLKPYLAALRDVGFDGVVSIELEYSPDPERIVEWVTEAYTATAKMMQELDIRG